MATWLHGHLATWPLLPYLCVGHRWEAALYAGHGGGHGQEGGHLQGGGVHCTLELVRSDYRDRDPGWGGLEVDPEGEPGHDDDHGAGDVDGDDVEGELPGELEVHLEAAVGTWDGGK